MTGNPNRDRWNATSERYQAGHGQRLAQRPKAWGAWQVPEEHLHALGELTELRVLELGCGGGQWSGALADDGVDVIGLDLSERQLEAAQMHMRTGYPLVQAAAEEIPFAGESFDVVFCDHGGLSWGDTHRVIPEVARVLRTGGRLVFCASSPWLCILYDEPSNSVGTTLQRPYFDLYAQDEGDGATSYTPTYGEWIRVFRRNGLVVEDLIEPRPAPTVDSGFYRVEPRDWAHHWPAEVLWVTRRERPQR